jgi:hypothetical protein
MGELIAGPSMVMTWTYSGGTVSLNADYRTFDWNTTSNFEDISAGQDTQVGRAPTMIDATANVTLVGQTSGTALVAALAAQTAGTLVVQPEGTAVGKRKITLPAYSEGAQYSFPYANVMTITCGFIPSSILGVWTDAANT